MNVAEKIAPLVALDSDRPAHVHSVKLSEGADGDMWVYVNAPPDPDGRARQRYLCFVAWADDVIAAELSVVEDDLAGWREAMKAKASEFGQIEFARLQAQGLPAEECFAQAKVAEAQREQKLLLTPPVPLTDRITELRAREGRLVAHPSDAPGASRVVTPGETLGLVTEFADWMLGQVA
jgi:hypothetical protein